MYRKVPVRVLKQDVNSFSNSNYGYLYCRFFVLETRFTVVFLKNIQVVIFCFRMLKI